MNSFTVSKRMPVLLLSVLGSVLAACSPPASAAAPTNTAAPAVLNYGGSGMAVNTYSAFLKAGVARVTVSGEGALTVDIDGPDGFSSQVLHAAKQADSMHEVQIPADGTYQITVDHVGTGSWKVTIDMTGAAAALPAAPSATPETAATAAVIPTDTLEPVPPTGTPSDALQFSGTGITVTAHNVSLPAGIARFLVSGDGALTVDITGPENFYYQVKHIGIPSETATDVRIPADGTYKIAIDFAGSGNWNVTIETSGKSSGLPEATATLEPTAAAAGGPFVFKGSGTSVYQYQVTLRTGNARFQVDAGGVLTVDITNAEGFFFQVEHLGLKPRTVTNVNIPADGTYNLGIDHVGSGAWILTVSQ
ncbi:MAG: hypothetical protein WBM17_12055 [Anaerolineales bacterium]